MSVTVRLRARRLLRGLVRGFLLVLAVYLVGRGVVEIFILDPSRPETYRQDWGGPHYVGVLAVHSGPGVVVLALAARRLRQRSRRSRSTGHLG